MCEKKLQSEDLSIFFLWLFIMQTSTGSLEEGDIVDIGKKGPTQIRQHNRSPQLTSDTVSCNTFRSPSKPSSRL